jgi:hypothetical protein
MYHIYIERGRERSDINNIAMNKSNHNHNNMYLKTNYRKNDGGKIVDY